MLLGAGTCSVASLVPMDIMSEAVWFLRANSAHADTTAIVQFLPWLQLNVSANSLLANEFARTLTIDTMLLISTLDLLCQRLYK